MATRAGGPLRDLPGAGRRHRAVDGRRAGDRLARAVVAAGPAVGAAEPDGRHRRWRRRCWSALVGHRRRARRADPGQRRPDGQERRADKANRLKDEANELAANERSRPTPISSRPTYARSSASTWRWRRSSSSTARSATTWSQGRPVQAAPRQAAARAPPTSTASSKACSRVRPIGPRAARWGMRTSSWAI